MNRCKGTKTRHSWQIVTSGNPALAPCGMAPDFICRRHWRRCQNCDQVAPLRWPQCPSNTAVVAS